MSAEVHIGQLIAQQFEQSGLSKAAFAKRINKTSQNIYSIFKRKSIDTHLLLAISEVLNHDFFQYFYTLSNNNVLHEPPATYNKVNTELTNCKAENKRLQTEITYLKEINTLLKKK